MSDVVRELFDEFQRDHETLGRGLHAIASALRACDDGQAGAAARELNHSAGAHIAFEERHFYPELRKLLGNPEVEAFENDHARGVQAIARLATLQPSESLTAAQRDGLLQDVAAMQAHTDECGEHFGAIGRVPLSRQEAFLAALRQLRVQSPTWTSVAKQGHTQ